jgi:hypothetical protein
MVGSEHAGPDHPEAPPARVLPSKGSRSTASPGTSGLAGEGAVRRDGARANRRIADPKTSTAHIAVCMRPLAANGVAERTARLGHAGIRKLRYAPPERSSRDAVDVVEVHDAVAGNTIPLRSELEFGNEVPLCPRQRRHGYGSDAICDWIPRQH